MGWRGLDRGMSLLHLVVFHMSGRVHTVRLVQRHVYECAFKKTQKGRKKEIINPHLQLMSDGETNIHAHTHARTPPSQASLGGKNLPWREGGGQKSLLSGRVLMMSALQHLWWRMRTKKFKYNHNTDTRNRKSKKKKEKEKTSRMKQRKSEHG